MEVINLKEILATGKSKREAEKNAAYKALKLLKDAELPFKISKWQVSKQFRKLCIGYGIKGAVFHTCRHNELTDFMRKHNLNVPETMKIAGHTDPRMLLRIYNNLEAQHVADKLNK